MADKKYILRQIGNATNTPVYYFETDTIADRDSIDTTNLVMGSRCRVIDADSLWELNSDKTWKPVSLGGGSGGTYYGDGYSIDLEGQTFKIHNIGSSTVTVGQIPSKNASGGITWIDAPSSKLGQAIVTQKAVGNVPAGTSYSADKALAEIIIEMFGNSTPETVNFFVGATTAVPTSTTQSGMTAVSESSTTIVSTSGYTKRIIAGDDTQPAGSRSQYPTFILPKPYQINRWYVSSFPYDLEYNTDTTTLSDYNIYYLTSKTYDKDLSPAGIEYTIMVTKGV